jgi:hypothetical protein
VEERGRWVGVTMYAVEAEREREGSFAFEGEAEGVVFIGSSSGNWKKPKKKTGGIGRSKMLKFD